MKLIFYWEDFGGLLRPSITGDGRGLLIPFLVDDGGLSLESILRDVGSGLAEVDSVIDGKVPTLSWDREDWGSELARDQVKIYSLLDESVFEIVSTTVFRSAVAAWNEFIRLPADASRTRAVDV